MVREVIAAAALVALPAQAAEPRIDEIVVATTMPAAQAEAELNVAKRFYTFWNTGDADLLQTVLSPGFTDHALPPGRPQGPAGPAFASEHFRQAVPDLAVDVTKMIVADTYVTVHMTFHGHFTGTFGATRGTGQPIRFIATDLLRISEGRITDNWHIEDNLALLTQMGVAKVGQ